MKRKLYLDIDGVVLDTPPLLDEVLMREAPDILKRLENDTKTEMDELKIREIFSKLNWEELIKKVPRINSSIEDINYLYSLDVFDIEFLTHVNSYHEAFVKKNGLNEEIGQNIPLTGVFEYADKSTAVDNCEGSILIDDSISNLILWEANKGISVKFSKYSNESSQFPCITNLSQILELLPVINSKNIKKLTKE